MRGAGLTTGLTPILAIVLAAMPAAGGELYVSGRLDRRGTSSTGGGADLEWHQRDAKARSFRLTLSGSALAGARWGSAGAGAVVPVGRTSIGMDGFVGRGNLEGSFGQIRGMVARPLVGSSLQGDAEIQYVGSRGVRGPLAKVGLTFLPRTSLLLHAGYFHSVGGGLGSELGLIKATYLARGRRYLIGGSVGRSSPTVLGVRGLPPASQPVRQAFAGAGFGLGGGAELIGLFDYYRLQSGNRSLLTLTWKSGNR
jgi:hypothetical protein